MQGGHIALELRRQRLTLCQVTPANQNLPIATSAQLSDHNSSRFAVATHNAECGGLVQDQLDDTSLTYKYELASVALLPVEPKIAADETRDATDGGISYPACIRRSPCQNFGRLPRRKVFKLHSTQQRETGKSDERSLASRILKLIGIEP